MAAELTLQDVSLHFGGIKVLQDVSFAVEPGQIFGLVGPNGAGKTSLFNCISGHYTPTCRHRADRRHRGAGRASGDARPARPGPDVPAPRAAAAGDGARERAARGAHPAPRRALEWSLRLPRTRRSEKELRAEALELLERNGLGWAAHLPADELSHGLHKGVELCRALLMKPRLLLLDEPAAGLPHAEVEHLIATVRRLRAEDDITVVIVEHHMGLIAALTDRVVVLDHGRTLMEGTAAEAQSDPRVIEAYIGKDAADDAA